MNVKLQRKKYKSWNWKALGKKASLKPMCNLFQEFFFSKVVFSVFTLNKVLKNLRNYISVITSFIFWKLVRRDNDN